MRVCNHLVDYGVIAGRIFTNPDRQYIGEEIRQKEFFWGNVAYAFRICPEKYPHYTPRPGSTPEREIDWLLGHAYPAVGAALAVVATRFNLFWLFVSLAVLALAGFLQFNATPDPTVQWISVIDSVAQSHLLGISIPAITATVGVGVLIFAFWLGESDRNRF
ncbi:hypothetical protein [Pseudomonas brenneri]|uniref:hypothetical protein n=1 Tax=Pseudomonas brenneri TaxID=129817 RepID=UPI003BA0F957